MAQTQAARHHERRTSLGEIGVAKLRALGRALGFGEARVEAAVEVFDLMSASWSDLDLGDRPPWPNDITDDGTPFELSVALAGEACELRMLMESQSLPATPTSSWDAGLALQTRLRDAGLASLERFHQVEDLFRPPRQSDARFSLWHAAVLTDTNRPLFKAYMNPGIRGRGDAPHLVREALARLNLQSAWEFLSEQLLPLGVPDIRYFALDLDDSKSARVKVYVGTSESAAEVETLLRGVANVAPGQATEWLHALTGRDGPFRARPILCCFAFTTGQAGATATVHVPIRCYVDDDEQAAQRVKSLLPSDAAARLARTLAAVADRPLGVGRGLLTYASLRPGGERLRLTVYLAPETYAIAAPRRGSVVLDEVAGGNGAIAFPEPIRASVRKEIAHRVALFAQHPLFGLLPEVGQARLEPLLPRLALLATFLRDAPQIVTDNAGEGPPVPTVPGSGSEEIVGLLQNAMDSCQLLSPSQSLLPSEEHDVARDWARAHSTQLLLRNDDPSRLAAWFVNALFGMLCRRILSSLETRPVQLNSIETGLPWTLDGGGLSIPATVAGTSNEPRESLERVAAAMSCLASDLEALLQASRSVAESAAFPLDGHEPKPQGKRRARR